MSRCEGLHCRGCGHGGGKAVIVGAAAVAALLAAEWVAVHAWEILAVTAVCGALAVAAVVALMRWGDRREARHAIERPFLVAREVPQIGNGITGIGSRVPDSRAIEGGLHIHLHGMDAAEQAEVIRQAINSGRK